MINRCEGLVGGGFHHRISTPVRRSQLDVLSDETIDPEEHNETNYSKQDAHGTSEL
ncbi:MAG TPA: hypothetical protein VGA56_02610 [Opitutaceae bacterium]